jgi:hypothetical protein
MNFMSGMTSPSSTGLSHDFLAQAIVLSQELLSDIFSKINSVADLTPEREYIWNNQLMSLTSDVSQFVEITTLISKVMMNRKHSIFMEIKESHIQLLFILKGVVQAQQKQDLFALEDLIKYELKDNLTQWKIDLIPQTKRLLNT